MRKLVPLLIVAACSRAREATVTAAPSAEAAVNAQAADAGAPPGALPEPAPVCEAEPGVTFFTSPASPRAGVPLRIVALSDRPLTGELRVGDARSALRRGGPPYFWTVEVVPDRPLVATLVQEACPDRPVNLEIALGKKILTPRSRSGLWVTRATWNHGLENLYSAWIEALFDAPEGAQPTWPALHEVIRDPKRNFLFDHFALAEDSGPKAPVIRPDCADLPYFLRAYFAWKMMLPFGLAECTRGGGGAPPSCRGLITNEDPDERAAKKQADGPTAAFGAFLRGTLADKAHSGSARTPFDDPFSDYYPVKLTWNALRPGTVYADPYGHVLVIAKRLPQTTERGGLLYAVDGQPDGTVARKRFWRGNFLYAREAQLGGPGFKHFRPLVREAGHLARVSDDALGRSAEYDDLSREASKLDVEGFYDVMDDVLSPRARDARSALLETLGALEEQVRTRVQSVDNGRKWLEKGASSAPMPEGPEIFETTGVWEDFSTPSRDLRLLIAIDVVEGFPGRVVRRPERYGTAMSEVELRALLARELSARSITYTRTDGSSFTLSLAEVVGRKLAFETTYNPNDCVESRWGAPAGSNELTTCRARAPAEQRARMESQRAWFHARRRPPRK